MPVAQGPMSRRSVLLGGLAGLSAVGLSACAGDTPVSGSNPRPSADRTAAGPDVGSDGTQAITLTVADDYLFRPGAFTVAPGKVRLTVLSTAEQLTHNFRFTPGGGPAAIEEQVEILPPGIEDTIEFTVDRVGDYAFECSFHVALGQVGAMIVVAG